MPKAFVFILFMLSQLLFMACNNKQHSVLTLPIDSVIYTAYRWRTKQDFSGLELFISHYISINKDGRYLAMRHNITSEPAQYCSGHISDSLIISLGSILKSDWDSMYFNPEPRIYDANTYNLVYKNDNRQKEIFFIPDDSPQTLHNLSSRIDSVIFNSRNQIPPFSLEKHQKNLEKKSLKIIGEPPKLKPPK